MGRRRGAVDVRAARRHARGNKLLFPTKPEARAQLAAWLGPPTKQDLRAAFAHRYKVGNLVLAAVMILVSTPWFMPAWLAPTTADPSALRFDYVLMSWGVSTLVCWVISKLAPHRALFLVDIVVHLAIAAWWAYGIAIGERTWWLIIMVLLMVFGAHVSSKHYRRFATMVAS